MHVPRYSLRTLLIATAYIAVVVMAFDSGTWLWALSVFSLSIGMTLLATLAALFASDPSGEGRRTRPMRMDPIQHRREARIQPRSGEIF